MNKLKIKSILSNGIIWGIGFTLAILITTGIYAYTTGLGGKVKDDPLTSSDWNNLVSNVDEVNSKFSFTGTNTIYSLGNSLGLSNGHLITLAPNGAMVFNSGPNDGSNNFGFFFRSTSILGTTSPYTDLMRLTGSGNLGIGTNTPAYKLHVNGTAGGTSWSNTSDQRFKKNIETINGALDKIDNLRGVYFDWRNGEFDNKNFENGKQVGFIVQEVEKILPELVTTDSDGYKAVKYSNLNAVLVEAIKEQQSQIEELRNEIKILKSRN